MKYKVHVELIFDDEVEAENEYEAFEIVSDSAIAGGVWNYHVEELEDNETNDGIKFYFDTETGKFELK